MRLPCGHAVPRAQPCRRRSARNVWKLDERIFGGLGLCRPVVVIQNAANTLTPPNRPRARLSSRILDQFVPETLMVAFALIVSYKFGERTPEVALTQRDQSVQAFLLDRAHEPLRVRIGASRRLHRRRAVRRKPFALHTPSIRCVGASSS